MTSQGNWLLSALFDAKTNMIFFAKNFQTYIGQKIIPYSENTLTILVSFDANTEYWADT
jgi:hypothetical protein